MRLLDRLVPLALSGLLVGAAPAQQPVPMPNSDWVMVMPVGSPVKFQKLGKYGVAHYSGRFLLSGTFSYGCFVECEGRVSESQLELVVYPDPEVAARLPAVKNRYGDMSYSNAIYIRRESRAMHAISTAEERIALRAGRLSEVRGRIAIIVDDFTVSGECDSVTNTARFVSLAKFQKLASAEPIGGVGCGA
jgi:hypothetical protein